MHGESGPVCFTSAGTDELHLLVTSLAREDLRPGGGIRLRPVEICDLFFVEVADECSVIWCRISRHHRVWAVVGNGYPVPLQPRPASGAVFTFHVHPPGRSRRRPLRRGVYSSSRRTHACRTPHTGGPACSSPAGARAPAGRTSGVAPTDPVSDAASPPPPISAGTDIPAAKGLQQPFDGGRCKPARGQAAADGNRQQKPRAVNE